jgi:hypothetical protein
VDRLVKLLSSEALDAEVVSGVSYGFALIFFVPLFMVAVAFLVYCLFARSSVIRPAKVLSVLWLVACVPAALLILMGYAFNSSKMNPLLSVPLWVLSGLVPLWFPVALRVLCRVKPV